MNVPIEYIVYKINILKKSLVLLGLLVISGTFLNKGFTLGVFMGGCISLAQFSLLSKHILQMKELAVKSAQRYIIIRFLLMYAIMGFALFIGIQKNLATFFGVAAGLLIVQATIYLDNFVATFKKNK